MADKFHCRLVKWRDIENWSKSIVKNVISSGYSPEIVIGLARGGLVPARLIADYLNIKDLYAVKTEHWGVTATPDGKAKLAQGLQVDISGKKILVVDDITDTGQSLKLALEHIEKQNPAEIRTATLLHITHSKYVPDYYAEPVPEENWTWFIFPWNVYEDLRNLVQKAMTKPMTIKEIKISMYKNFDIDVSIRILGEVLKDLKRRGIVNKSSGKWELIS